MGGELRRERRRMGISGEYLRRVRGGSRSKRRRGEEESKMSKGGDE